MTQSNTRAYVFSLILVTTALSSSTSVFGDSNVHTTARDFISQFRDGRDFNTRSTLSALVREGGIDPFSLSLLTRELRVGAPQVRLNIVQLLAEVGLQADTASAKKFPLIRDPRIIRALLVEGFAKNDAAATEAAKTLADHCTPRDLAAFGGIYLNSLKRLQGDYLYIAAKAKTLEALPYVNEMAGQPEWQAHPRNVRAVQVAQAALGNSEVEDALMKEVRHAEQTMPPAPPNRFYDVGSARDGTEVAKKIAVLGLVGTKESLVFICGYLRSTLKAYVPHVNERSVRYAALDALRYNFPDERLLYNPVKHADWAAAEQFCVQKIGAAFDGPTPDLPADVIYPHHMR
ncbi:hypothetical protein ACFFTM_09880 [Pseudoduganella plicata]|uniref:HEAT repeat domain-containing protein n=1 Tax=Pseudoduganella plicata TaxID=321984 RepID=A0A4V1ATC0_9BURK|nr:hypothetical protein [Pseudoduganella plicata]QBQ35138.1 hypothetical protein E1742_02340 [Pseudoduganella plicata]GGZ05596.1 hypothetical protein GCM10007388_44160 [Pseudoduganella plicata]